MVLTKIHYSRSLQLFLSSLKKQNYFIINHLCFFITWTDHLMVADGL